MKGTIYEAQMKYDRKNTKTFCIKLNYGTDANLISFLETQENVQGYIKSLIRKDIDRIAGTYEIMGK